MFYEEIIKNTMLYLYVIYTYDYYCIVNLQTLCDRVNICYLDHSFLINHDHMTIIVTYLICLTAQYNKISICGLISNYL